MNTVMDLLTARGITPKKASGHKGGEYHSPCPGCGGKDRFHVWPEQNGGAGSWWCRGCGLGGDAIQFLMDFERLEFREACERLGRTVPDSPRLRTPAPPRRAPAEWEPEVVTPPAEKWQTHALKLVDWAAENLTRNHEQLAWLASRGIDAEAAARHRLGWNPGKGGRDLYRDRAAWGLPEELKDDGKPKKLWLPIGLVIPAFAEDGALLRIRIRRPVADEPRYYVVPGSGMARMLIRPRARAFVVVEAELDGILVAAHAPEDVGALALGSASARPDATAAAAVSRAEAILVALDSDQAGALAWDNPKDPTRWTWRAKFQRAVRWPVPVGKDPGEAYAEGLDVEAWVLAGLPPSMTVGRLPSGLEFLRGVGGFLADVPDSGATRRLGEFLATHTEAGLRLILQDGGSLNFEFPADWDDARRDEVWALWDDVEAVIFGGGE